MNKFDEATATLDDRDWSTAHADDKPRTATVVQSVPRPHRTATQGSPAPGRHPSEVIRDLVEAGLDAVDGSVTVRLADVRRVIDSLASKAA